MSYSLCAELDAADQIYARHTRQLLDASNASGVALVAIIVLAGTRVWAEGAGGGWGAGRKGACRGMAELSGLLSSPVTCIRCAMKDRQSQVHAKVFMASPGSR